MKKIFFLSFLIICFVSVYSQNRYNIDTTKLLYSAKLQILESESAEFNQKNITVFLEKQQTSFLKSKGFSDVYFILIKNRASYFDSIFTEKHKEDFKKNLRFHACNYVLSYNCRTGLYYKLKGFRNNDFEAFINDMIRTNNIMDFTIENKDVFMYSYYVEDLDLSCLWEYYFGKRKKRKEYDCVKSCKYRDMEIERLK